MLLQMPQSISRLGNPRSGIFLLNRSVRSQDLEIQDPVQLRIEQLGVPDRVGQEEP